MVEGSAPSQGNRRSALDRLLRLFTEVRAGESGTVLLLALNVFILLAAYYLLRILREPLISAQGGAVAASYSYGAQAILLLGLVPAYGALASRVPRRLLINIVTVFFVVCIAIFFGLTQFAIPIGIAFFVWVGVFSVMIVAQFWAFANDIYTTEEGKRLFPIVAFGASAGATFGAWIADPLIRSLGINSLMIMSAVLLLIAAAVTNYIDARERRRTETDVPDVLTSGLMPAATSQVRAATGQFEIPKKEHLEASGTFKTIKAMKEEEEQVPTSTGSAFALVFRNRYLLLIALLVMLLNWVNTNGEFILRETVNRAAAEAVANGTTDLTESEFVGTFYSSFQFWVSLIGLFAQLFIVSRILKYLGVRVAILMLPVLAMTGYAILVFLPILPVIRLVKTAENATDYSVNNIVRNVLFLPTTREEKYKAKQAIDSFFHRAGDVLHSATVFIGTTWLAFTVTTFAVLNIGLVVVWLVIAILIGKRYGRMEAAG